MNLTTLRNLATVAAITLTATAANALTLTGVNPSISEPIDEIPRVIDLYFDKPANLFSNLNFSGKQVKILSSDGQVISSGSLSGYMDDWDGKGPHIKISHNYAITTSGVYTLDIPANTICEDENESNPAPAIHLQWTVGSASGPVDPDASYILPTSISPETGTTVESLGTIVMYFPGQLDRTDDSWNNPALNRASLKDQNGNIVATSNEYSVGYEVRNGRTGVTINFSPEIEADGIYSLTLEKGILVSQTDDTIFNDEVNLTYTVYNPANHTGKLMYSSIVPPNNTEVEYLGTDKIRVYFDEPIEYCDGVYNTDRQKVTMTDHTGATICTITLDQNYNWDTNKGYLGLRLPADIEAPGTYTIRIPAGTVQSEANHENKNEEIVLRWTIKDQSQGGDDTNCSYTLAFSSCYPAAEGSTYNFSEEGGAFDRVLANWDSNAVCNPAVKPYIEDANGIRTMATMVSDFNGSTTVLFDANQTKLWKSGRYTLVLPKGLAGSSAWKASGFTEGECNPEVSVAFNYVQDPSLEAGDFEDELEMTRIEFFDLGTEECLAQFLNNTDPIPNVTGGDNVRLIIGANINEIAKDIYVELRDDTLDEYIWSANTWYQNQTSVTDTHTMNGKNANGEYELDFTNSNWTMEFLRNHEYSLNIAWYEKYDGVPEKDRVCYGKYVVRFKGTTREYEYSPVKIVSVSLPEGSVINTLEEAAISVTFSGPVNMGGSNDLNTRFVGAGWSDYESITSNADRTVWTLTPKASALNNCEGNADYRMAPRDDQGRALRSDVYYTSGQKDATYITLSYNCFFGGSQIACDPDDGTTVDELYSFKFTVKGASGSAANIGYNSNSVTGALHFGQLFDSNGEVVGTLDRNDIVTTPSGEYDIDVTMHIEEKVTTPGTYTLRLPGALFTTGTESSSKSSRPMTYTYVIEGDAPAKTTCTFTYIIDNHSAITHEVAKGSTVAIKIAPSDNFEIAELTLNGEKQAFNGNRYVTPELNDDEATLNLTHRYANNVMFDFTTGVETVEGCDLRVVNVADGIEISGLAGSESIYVFNTAGVEVARVYNSGNTTALIKLDRGIYVVVVDGVSLKVKH